jgi:hypothetical protein
MWVRKTPKKWQNLFEIIIVISLIITYGLLVKAIINEIHPM